jgi:predicted MPP superfamily phosphohydrolase
VKQLTRALKALKRPAYAVLGNHDHWSDAPKIRAALADAGVEVLTNEHRVLTHAGQALHLVGIDDSVTKHDDADAAFAGVPDGATSVVLSHDPKSADWIHRFRPTLILSGHTHGGQFFVPKITDAISDRLGMKYLSGFFGVEGAVLYVNRGLGASIPLRFRAPVEVAQLTLRSHAVTQSEGHDGSAFAA